jgi:hypothetical protein
MRRKLLVAMLGTLLVGSLVLAASWRRQSGDAVPSSRKIFPKVLEHQN